MEQAGAPAAAKVPAPQAVQLAALAEPGGPAEKPAGHAAQLPAPAAAAKVPGAHAVQLAAPPGA